MLISSSLRPTEKSLEGAGAGIKKNIYQKMPRFLLCACVQLCLTLCNPTQTPLLMGFPKQKHWSGLRCPPPGEFANIGMETAYHLLPHIISLDHLHAPSPSILYPVSNIDC